jgi:NAD(P)H-dependent FMN reductase
MKTILAFGASNSVHSINKKLASYTASLLEGYAIDFIDLNDFEMPIYSIDRENAHGIHPKAVEFKKHIKSADGIIISFAEHNGAYSTAFKNIFDWISRIGPDVWESKPMFLLATSPGANGGKSVLQMAYERFSRRNKNIMVTFSLPEFGKNFSVENGIQEENLRVEFGQKIMQFEKAVNDTPT